MRIGVDIRPLQLQHSVRGIGMHVRALIVELLQHDDDDELVLYLYEGLDDPIKKLSLPKMRTYTTVYLKNYKEQSSILPNVVASSIGIMRRVLTPLPRSKMQQCDVLIGFDFMHGLPRRRDVKYFLVAYDLIPVMFKKDYFPSFRTALRGAGLVHALHTSMVAALYRHALQIVKRRRYNILSISDSTKEQFVDILHIEPSLIRTVHLGNPLARSDFKPTAKDIKRVRAYKKDSYILFIGGNDPRRRLQDAIHAFNQLRGRGHQLKFVFAGFDFQSLDTIVNYKTRRAIETSSYIDDIDLLGFINDSEKKYLYENALCFVFPSVSEGFGLPILEAQQEHCPVIAYDYPYSSMREVAGNSAIMTPPGATHIFSAIQQLIDQPDHREQLIQLGLKNTRRFGWDKCAQETIASLKELG